MNLEFVELELKWTSELNLYDLRSFILSRLLEYGEPLRWAITSINSKSGEKIQIISVEAVLIINRDKVRGINTN